VRTLYQMPRVDTLRWRGVSLSRLSRGIVAVVSSVEGRGGTLICLDVSMKFVRSWMYIWPTIASKISRGTVVRGDSF